MEIIKSKKGIYFTIVTVIMISILIGYTTFNDNSRMKQKGNILSNRAMAMNNLLLDIEKDFDRMILIGGYRAVLSMQKYTSETGLFLDDFDSVFSPLFIDGTYNGTNYSLMQDASLNDWEGRIQEETDILNLNFNIIPNEIWVTHSSPWDLRIFVNATIILTDLEISWNYTKIFSNDISIAEFEDPLYKIKTNNKVTNLLIKTNITDFVDDTTNNTENLQKHLNKSYYNESTDGPSFIMRFEGNFNSSPYGIESMVDLAELSAQAIPLKSKSVIDYIYFDDDSSTTDICFESGQGLPDWFRIDDNHVNKYELYRLKNETC